nr:hypothetical protein CFP56_59829 [Quercus suber]
MASLAKRLALSSSASSSVVEPVKGLGRSLRELRYNPEPEMVLYLVQGPVPNHLKGHIPNYWLVREE